MKRLTIVYETSREGGTSASPEMPELIVQPGDSASALGARRIRAIANRETGEARALYFGSEAEAVAAFGARVTAIDWGGRVVYDGALPDVAPKWCGDGYCVVTPSARPGATRVPSGVGIPFAPLDANGAGADRDPATAEPATA